MQVTIFTDGACRGNPGPGGWGVVMYYGAHRKILKGAERETTNNRMELMAAIAALRALKKSVPVVLTTDSQYVRLGITQWLPRWQQRGWKNSKNQPVKNQDLWEKLAALANEHVIEWHWVKGHSGHPDNEAADLLANQAIDELLEIK